MPDFKNMLNSAKRGLDKTKEKALVGLDKAKVKAIDTMENIDKEKLIKNTEKALLYSGEATLHVSGTVSKLVAGAFSVGSECESISDGEQEACKFFAEVTYNLSEGLHVAGKALGNIRKNLDENNNDEISQLVCSNEEDYQNIEDIFYDDDNDNEYEY